MRKASEHGTIEHMLRSHCCRELHYTGPQVIVLVWRISVKATTVVTKCCELCLRFTSFVLLVIRLCFHHLWLCTLNVLTYRLYTNLHTPYAYIHADKTWNNTLRHNQPRHHGRHLCFNSDGHLDFMLISSHRIITYGTTHTWKRLFVTIFIYYEWLYWGGHLGVWRTNGILGNFYYVVLYNILDIIII